MVRFENQVFPLEDANFNPPDHTWFRECRFNEGLTLIPNTDHHLFENCVFQVGSVLRFIKRVLYVRFYRCTFESTAKIDIGDNCVRLTLESCHFPENLAVFDGSVAGDIYLFYSSPSIFPSSLPRCGCLRLTESILLRRAYREIPENFTVPRGVCISYKRSATLRDSRSLDILANELWRNPLFNVDLIYWNGAKEDLEHFNKIRHHPNRRDAIVIVTLLYARVLPWDLVRGVLVDFLV